MRQHQHYMQQLKLPEIRRSLRQKSLSNSSYRQRRKKNPSQSQYGFKQESYLDKMGWISTQISYDTMTLKELLREQEKLRQSLKFMNTELASILKEKALTFKLRTPIPTRSVQLSLQVIDGELENGDKIIRNLKINHAQLQQRLDFIRQEDLFFILEKNVEEVKQRIEEARRDLKDQKRLNTIRSKRMSYTKDSEWPILLNELSKMTAKRDGLFQQSLGNKVNMEKTEEQTEITLRKIMDLEYEYESITKLEQSQNEAKEQESQVSKLKKTIDSMQKVLKSAKETQQRNYLKRLQDMEKQLTDSNNLSERVQELSRQNEAKRAEYEQLKKLVERQESTGMLSSALITDRQRHEETQKKDHRRQTNPVKKQLEELLQIDEKEAEFNMPR